jgi:hypothetical protein
LQLDAPIPDTIFLSLSGALFEEARYSVTLSGGESVEWAVQAEPGEYVLSVFAQWDDLGDVSYFFSVQLAG